MRYHLAKRRSATSARAGDKWKFCNKGFHSFYMLREHKQRVHGTQRESGVRNVDVTEVI